MKTHKGTAKRVRFTATGKAMLRRFNPKRAKRARSKMYDVNRDLPAPKNMLKSIRRNLPGT